mgnify:CR=1 FL=1
MRLASYLLIANPVAGRGAGAVRAETLRSLLASDNEVELATTSGRGNATALARSRGANVDRVIAIGGDGTLNEVVTGLMSLGDSLETRPALGFLPAGTANVAASAFGFSQDPAEAARRLSSARGRPVDVGVAEVAGSTRSFLLWCGAGVAAVVIDELNSARTGHMGVTGLVMNSPRGMAGLVRYSAPRIRISADGEDASPAASVILANVGEVAFGGTVHPGASPFDGRLDVVMTESASPFAVLMDGACMMLSSLTASPRVRHQTAKVVTLDGDQAVPVQIDGEPVGGLPVSVRLHEGAICILVDEVDQAAH